MNHPVLNYEERFEQSVQLYKKMRQQYVGITSGRYIKKVSVRRWIATVPL